MDFAKFASEFSGFVWGVPLIVLLFGTHVFLTFRTGFIQRHLVKAIKISFSREKEGAGDVSQFGALMTALAALVIQLMMLHIQVPVDAVGEGGAVTTTLTDPGALFYLVIGLLVASLVLIFVHPGKDDGQ